MGDAVEHYVKDLFANSLDATDENEARDKHKQVFSYLGNSNNPPDCILINGDAIEVKKIESLRGSLALNSSYPKHKLYSNSTLITNGCRQSDGGTWTEKDIIYVIAIVQASTLHGLWFIYGDCYAAEKDIYERIAHSITDGILTNTNITLDETNELARVNKVDPLGITYLRVRGMWGVENPIKVFHYLGLDTSSNFFAHAIMRKSKYNSFSKAERKKLEQLVNHNSTFPSFKIIEKTIKDPNNPILDIDTVILSYNK